MPHVVSLILYFLPGSTITELFLLLHTTRWRHAIYLGWEPKLLNGPRACREAARCAQGMTTIMSCKCVWSFKWAAMLPHHADWLNMIFNLSVCVSISQSYLVFIFIKCYGHLVTIRTWTMLWRWFTFYCFLVKIDNSELATTLQPKITPSPTFSQIWPF